MLGDPLSTEHQRVAGDAPAAAGGENRLRGNGELSGLEWRRESGLLMPPIALTNSDSVGVVGDALAQREIAARGPGKLF